MQNAYASYQVTQLIAWCSLLPAVVVQLAFGSQFRLVFHPPAVVARLAFQAIDQPGSLAAASAPTPARPLPPFRRVCLPEPSVGRNPLPTTALTKLRNRPTVTS